MLLRLLSRRRRLRRIRPKINIIAERRLIYISLPKVASTTLKAGLIRFAQGDPDYQPVGVQARPHPAIRARSDDHIRRSLARINRPDWLRICFVRDPYARALSAYLDRIAPAKGGRFQPSQRRARASLGLQGRQTLSFAEFLERVARQRPETMNSHWRPQVDSLLWGEIRYDFVGRLEAWDEEVERLSALLGAELRPFLQRHPRATGAAERLDDYYDEELRALAAQIWRRDFEALGYPIGPTAANR